MFEEMNSFRDVFISGSCEIVLKINNQVIERKTVTLDPDQSTTVSFTYTPQDEGSYSIDVNGLTGSLAASKEAGLGIPTEMIIIIVAAVVAVVVLAILFSRRKKPPEAYPPPPK